jgi:hypothetical protein
MVTRVTSLAIRYLLSVLKTKRGGLWPVSVYNLNTKTGQDGKV